MIAERFNIGDTIEVAINNTCVPCHDPTGWGIVVAIDGKKVIYEHGETGEIRAEYAHHCHPMPSVEEQFSRRLAIQYSWSEAERERRKAIPTNPVELEAWSWCKPRKLLKKNLR